MEEDIIDIDLDTKNKKRDFLINKFNSEQKELELGTMQDFVKYYFKFFKANSSSRLDFDIIHTLFEIMSGTNKKPNILIFNNGGGNAFDIFTFEKGKGRELIKEVPVYAYLIDGVFKINSHLPIPRELYNPDNYEYVLENF